MSVFIVPSGHPFNPFGDQHPGRQQGSRPFHGGNRFCGQSNVNNVGDFWGHPGQFSQHSHHHPRGVHPHGHPHHHHHHRGHGHIHGHPFFSPFEQEFDEEDENVDQWTQFIRSRIQQQQQQAIERERQERERERERRRIQRQREQEYQQFLVQQQQQELQRQRQRQRQRFAATRVVHEVVDNFASIFDNFAQAATEEIQNRRRQQWQAYQSQRHAAAQAQAQAAHDEAERQQQSEPIQDQQKQQWEELASQGLATALQFAEWFGESLQGDDDEEEKKTEEKKQEDDVMQVDEKQQQQQESSSSSKQVEIQVEDVKEPIVNDSTLSDQDPPEEDIAAPSTPVQQTETKEDNLLFNYPLPIDISKRSSLKADDIQVTYDQPTRTIQIRGLWDNSLEDQEQSSSSSSTTTVGEGYTIKDDDDQSSSSRGRKRSRSPKRSRVSEVDEKTGEEIVIEDQEDGFVNLSSSTNIPPVVEKGKQPQGLAKVSVPQGANLANLRAELTDEGFKLYI